MYKYSSTIVIVCLLVGKGEYHSYNYIGIVKRKSDHIGKVKIKEKYGPSYPFNALALSR